ncbi:hypothetical protein Cgig2_015560 [Carnegiea gigantea]|uniref:Uncharacterized protein n=1 Tax=Carnegiea gigantea TaxID=171969 RepID=A0A9Q1K244_9CARY|nr:hypothetical protein Cgig2_015560 [Carnegiea gigantea]
MLCSPSPFLCFGFSGVGAAAPVWAPDPRVCRLLGRPASFQTPPPQLVPLTLTHTPPQRIPLQGNSLQNWRFSINTIILPYDIEILDRQLQYLAERDWDYSLNQFYGLARLVENFALSWTECNGGYPSWHPMFMFDDDASASRVKAWLHHQVRCPPRQVVAIAS